MSLVVVACDKPVRTVESLCAFVVVSITLYDYVMIGLPACNGPAGAELKLR